MTLKSMDLGKDYKIFGQEGLEVIASISTYASKYEDLNLDVSIGYFGSGSSLSFNKKEFLVFCDFVQKLKEVL